MDYSSASTFDGLATGRIGDCIYGAPTGGTEGLDSLIVSEGMMVEVDGTRLCLETGEPSDMLPISP